MGERRKAEPPRFFLFSILALALVLRWGNLLDQGIVHYDEAAHLLEGRFFRSSIERNLLGGDSALEGLPLFHGKPLHAALIALTQSLVGDHEWTGSALSALFGLGTVILVYDLGRRLWGTTVGLLGAGLLASLPWSVLYGRLALPEADSTFLALWATRVQIGGWLTPGRGSGEGSGGGLGRAAAVGILTSLAFLANYRWLLLPLFYIGITLAARATIAKTAPPARERGSKTGSGELWKRVLVFSGALVLPVVIADGIYGAFILGPLADETVRPRTYFEDLAYNIGKFQAMGMGVGLRDPLRFPFYFVRFGGPILVLTLGAGLWAGWRVFRAGHPSSPPRPRRPTLRPRVPAERPISGAPGRDSVQPDGREPARRRFGFLVLLLLGGLPALLLLASPCGFPRCLSLALAPWALLAGTGLEASAKAWAAKMRHRRGRESNPEGSGQGDPADDPAIRSRWASGRVAALLGGAAVIIQTALCLPLFRLHSGYGEASRWLRQRGESKCVASQAYAFQVHGIHAVGLPASLEELRRLVPQGYHYLLVDNQIWISGYASTYREIRQRSETVQEIPHPAGGSATFAWESPESTLEATRERNGGPDWFRPSRLLVYDLRLLPPSMDR